MLKIWLCLGLFMVLLAVPIHAQSVTMLPNSTHGMSYKMSADMTCEGTPASATVAYTDADYNNVNTSNNGYFSTTASCINNDFTGDCIHTRYAFNVTQVNTSAIQWIYYCMEGYFTTVLTGSTGYIWFRNTTAWYQNTTLTTSDATYCYNLSTNVAQYINTDGTFQVGAQAGAYGGGGGTETTTLYVDYVNVTVGFVGVTDSCTYGGSGNWFININDNCTLSTPNTVNGNIYIYGSNGWLNFQANQFAHGYYYNVSSLGTWYYNNYRWLY